jgi:hypothetical protein
MAGIFVEALVPVRLLGIGGQVDQGQDLERDQLGK